MSCKEPVPGDYAGQLTECRTCRVRLEFSVSLDLEVVSCVFRAKICGDALLYVFCAKKETFSVGYGKEVKIAARERRREGVKADQKSHWTWGITGWFILRKPGSVGGVNADPR